MLKQTEDTAMITGSEFDLSDIGNTTFLLNGKKQYAQLKGYNDARTDNFLQATFQCSRTMRGTWICRKIAA